MTTGTPHPARGAETPTHEIRDVRQTICCIVGTTRKRTLFTPLSPGSTLLGSVTSSKNLVPAGGVVISQEGTSTGGAEPMAVCVVVVKKGVAPAGTVVPGAQ